MECRAHPVERNRGDGKKATKHNQETVAQRNRQLPPNNVRGIIEDKLDSCYKNYNKLEHHAKVPASGNCRIILPPVTPKHTEVEYFSNLPNGTDKGSHLL
ncbi:unnamed protein product [Nezara viridula]|uniref:Uncharacterized protein n=1 Tax=Nezara viridula TaxID=85310 RepID=A0A9P0HCV6_NEZVI|nr:unnamed protein product [Nezara viridula]